MIEQPKDYVIKSHKAIKKDCLRKQIVVGGIVAFITNLFYLLLFIPMD